MREVLFRGKRVDTKEWVYGYYFKGFTGIPYILVLHDHILKMTEFYEVISETIGQFTGLTDKNNKRIFEGDIYVTDYNQHTLKNNVQVLSVGGAFCGGNTCLRCSPLAWISEEDNEELYLDEEFLNHIVVIGNINDNPELLEAKS